MNKEYTRVEFFAGSTIEDAVKELFSYQENGINAYGEFNGVTLYSDSVTLDNAYQAITGKTKKAFDEAQQKWQDDYTQKKNEHESKIPELTSFWMERGREVLPEEKWALWDQIVPIRLGDLYRGMELGNCLDIIAALNRGESLDKAKEIIENQGHSFMSFGLVCAMVKEFCQNGEEFVAYVR